MNTFLAITLKSAVALGIFALIYCFFLLKDVNFRIRRLYLLISLSLSFILPFLKVTLPGGSAYLPAVLLDELSVYSNGVKIIRDTSTFTIIPYLVSGYFLISGFLLLRIIFQILMVKIKSINQYARNLDGLRIHHLPDSNVSFSFFRDVFIGRTTQPEDMDKILAHEQVHASQMHTLDVIYIELISCLFWFNPLVWWYKSEIRNVHEYLADEGALANGFSLKSYQITLLENLIGSASFSITNHFNYSLIKNRIAMMNKERNIKSNMWKVFLILPLSIILLIGYSCTENLESNSELKENEGPLVAFSEADVMPEFSEGIEGIKKFLAQELRYPKSAAEKGISGKIFVQFVVDKDGNVVQPNQEIKFSESGKDVTQTGIVVVGFKPENSVQQENSDKEIQSLKDEAIRAVSKMPKFKPGLKNGKPVNVLITIPINFVLQ